MGRVSARGRAVAELAVGDALLEVGGGGVADGTGRAEALALAEEPRAGAEPRHVPGGEAFEVPLHDGREALLGELVVEGHGG